MSARSFDYTPGSGSLYAVVSTEHDPPLLLGTWLGTSEDAVCYFDSGADEEEHWAHSDCVRLIKLVEESSNWTDRDEQRIDELRRRHGSLSASESVELRELRRRERIALGELRRRGT